MITKKQGVMLVVGVAFVLIGIIGVLLWGDPAFKGGANTSARQNMDASTQACALSPERKTALNAAIKGEVAAFALLDNPRPVANLAFQDETGAARTLENLKGKALLINLWATWCAPCRHEMPALDALQQKRGGDGFEVVAINIDTRNLERPRAWLKETGIKNLKYYSDAQAKSFQTLRAQGVALGMPITLLVDARGCHIGHLNGPAAWESEDALTLIDQLKLTQP
jgi:thiol-disulfide isomerase/thioredoxin